MDRLPSPACSRAVSRKKTSAKDDEPARLVENSKTSRKGGIDACRICRILLRKHDRLVGADRGDVVRPCR